MIMNAMNEMKNSLERTDSPDEAERRGGFDAIAKLAAELPEAAPGALGFFDNALFCARKHASDGRESVRNAVVSALLAIGARSASWREAAGETADEIGMQPSEAARWVAARARTKSGR